MDFKSSLPKRYLWFPFLIINTTILLSLSTTSSAGNTSDYLALVSFKSLISDDPLGALASWNSTNPNFCQWQGVICNDTDHPQRVSGLDLNSLNLTGSIPPAISNLTFLTNLDLSANNFQGLIPQELGRLLQLQYLNLSFNSLGGEVPASLSNCSHLRRVVLYTNMLVGMIPEGLGSLSNLLSVNLGENSLSGPIPASFGNISSLTDMLLYNAGVEGRIPDSLGKLKKLKIFQVSMNNLSGEIPSSIYNLSSLQYFVAGNNNLVGTLPRGMFDALPNLQMVLLFDNRFNGPIPISLPNASKLVELDFKENSFTGPIPSNLGNLRNLYWMNLNANWLEASQANGWDFLTSLTNCTRLGTLGLSNNRLGGILPSSIANLSSHMDILSIGENQIAGSIPDGIGNLANLSALLLHGNKLTGVIPSELGSLRKLYALRLSGNSFSGQIPSSFGNLTQLDQLDLRASGIEGSIPVTFGNCRSLIALDLSENKLNGFIPKELFSIVSLSELLNISHNFLSGTLPFEVSKMTHLSAFDVSNNRLSGEIPSSLGDCESLEFLYMQNNLFDGTISQSMSRLEGLRELDLSSNNLSGSIPGFLGRSSLVYLNLSLNNFEGEVPKEGIFLNASEVSVIGNNKLCGGVPQLHLPRCSTQSSSKHSLSKTLIIIISVFGLVLFLIVLLIVFVILHRKKVSRLKYSSNSLKDSQFMKITYAELARATNQFSSSNLIGAGSFGSVYKGILNEGIVAVKVLNLKERGASKSFIAECQALGNIRHRNLVRILTTCSTVDSQGNDFKSLILEFMSNGSLEDWLHPEVLEQRNLSLLERLNIAIDVAFALEYLHHHAHKPIVHCDLKPSNVLLDEDMCAHVSDFGLARFLSDKAAESDEYQTLSAGVRGTIGYIAPVTGSFC
ncbi:probable LRR receptor-like serine/threonine-protein kinase At3g47570 isoform X2 [Asparagus officinalis]|uniref:probable LRR receptor-like serine/threonine-protein kinase At3g47570 isoform X2 n=1 Tax=Asparagus officinalis TaxID=4686 RepID=UPI00098E34B1|nr:probable LRR receptor-like serine/threonine-protein kinase At3g47570 isoform X2 [Asparagus officinalis]